jgi:glycosyltransferase involved in cell wall biosynthesis
MASKVLVTLPCYNEELVLKRNAAVIHDFIKENCPGITFSILIIDNASTDSTWQVAQELSEAYPGIFICTQIFTPGRGAALREAWQKYPGYDIYSYMDIDLATDLKDFPQLLRSVQEGGDYVTGSRYIRGSDVERTFKRVFLSRIYNLLLKIVFRVSFKDAQCGFKAFSNKLVTELVPKTIDCGWFWDTELMIFADRGDYTIVEIPVTWREVRDELRQSKVSPGKEIQRQLKNIYSFYRRLHS